MQILYGLPMTPASSIMHWLAPRASKYGMVMKQMEDEIAAVNAPSAAARRGARMTEPPAVDLRS